MAAGMSARAQDLPQISLRRSGRLDLAGAGLAAPQFTALDGMRGFYQLLCAVFWPAGYLRKNPDQVLMRTRSAVAYQDINGKFHYLSAGDTIAVSRECAAGLASSINWELA